MSADEVLRASVAGMPIPDLPEPAFTTPPPLHEARVAIVTTAGLMRHGEAPWTHDDASFRVFGRDEPDLIVGHVSMSFDRSGVILDRNVAIPLDRLAELAADGVIGSVADRHISFMGALRADELLRTVMLDSGPAAASVLRADGVDAVLLTPMCPACSRTVTLLGHLFEAEGLATVVLGSNAEITARARPPRSLVCNFPLGRPLGRPNDPAFQRRVLEAALGLLARPEGPVLETFPETIEDEADTPVACVLPPRYDPSVPPAKDEAGALRPAWERAKAGNGTTHVGRRVDADGVPGAVEKFIEITNGTRWDSVFSDADDLLQTAMDIRIYYEEAALALVDHVPAARSTEAWFYQRTETGQLLRNVVRILRDTGQEQDLDMLALYYIVPLSQWDGDRDTAPWTAPIAEDRGLN